MSSYFSNVNISKSYTIKNLRKLLQCVQLPLNQIANFHEEEFKTRRVTLVNHSC